MKSWNLYTKNGYFFVSNDGLISQDEPLTDERCVISPSFNYRKYITIPSDINRTIESIREDLFEKSLPNDLEKFQYQFVDLGTNVDGQREFLALAVDGDVYESIQTVSFDSVYFFESLVARNSYSEIVQLEVPFPDGVFYGIYENHLSWSRFISNPEDTQLEMTQTYIEENFGTVDEELTAPQLESGGEPHKEWVEALERILPDRFDDKYDLLKTGHPGFVSEIKTAFVSLLILTFLSASMWIFYENSLQAEIGSWVQTKYQKVTGDESNNPHRVAQQRLKKIRKQLKRSQKPYYPRLADIDRALSKYPLQLFRIDFTPRVATLVLFSPSLEDVEQFRGTLSKNEGIESVSINSTNNTNVNDFNYEVTLEVRWNNEQT